MSDREMYCATCEVETLFEAPPRSEEYDEECPELLCTGCGTAILIAPVVVWSFMRPGGARVAPQQRRAA
jgi:hypothetical protein